ncbi:MFS transporter [Microbacterium sp. NPDC089321]|uniref:MFS transporter n=1 Tax=Microbacterium sp. NPDC089321 TaxID=3155183 RepID=UPI00341C1133
MNAESTPGESDRSDSFGRVGTGFWAGRLASTVGGAMASLAMPFFLTVHLQMAPVEVSIVLTGPLLVTILSPLYAGVIADLLDRKRVSIFSELARSALLCSLALVAAANVSDLVILSVVNALIAVASSIYSASFKAGLPDILGEEQLQAGNARLQTLITVAESGSAALGGAALSIFGAVAIFGVTAFSYLLSAACLVKTKWPHSRADAGGGEKLSYLRRVSRGFAAVRESRLLTLLLVTSSLANLVIHVTAVALLFFLVRDLEFPFFLYSLVLAVGSAGAVIGALAMTHLSFLRDMSHARIQTAALVGYGAFLVGYGVLWASSASSFTVACVMDFGIGFCISIYVVRNMTQQQTAVGRESRGSVSSVRTFSTALAGAAGTAAAGVVIEVSSARAVVTVCGLALAVGAFVYGLLIKKVGVAPMEPTQCQGKGKGLV